MRTLRFTQQTRKHHFPWSTPHRRQKNISGDGGNNPPESHSVEEQETASQQQYNWRFWAIFGSLVAATLLSALDGSIVSTALPTIAETLDMGPDSIWAANVYFLTGAVVQPLFGQLSDLWGRRWIFLSILAIFVLGSGLCGGASTGNMLIAARAVQGVGAGGINMMVDLIICDLVPMRDRSKFLGMIFMVIGIFLAVGPLVGGAFAAAGLWRWVFYINLPIGVPCIVVNFLFLRVKSREDGGSFTARMKHVDWIGITILTISTLAIMYAVSYGGSLRSWSDSSVITPLVAGLLCLAIFALCEGSPFVREPVTPYHLFANRTSAAAFAITFLHSIMSLWIMYTLAIYFQAVLAKSQTLSGVYLIPTVIGFPMSAAVGGILMSKIGRYKPIHLAGFSIFTLGAGLCSILDTNSSPAAWVFFQLFMAVGTGVVMPCLLPAVQVELKETDTALSTGTWAFIRSVGIIWGVTIPVAIFNNRFDQLIGQIEDQGARDLLGNGQAYAHATADVINSFSDVTREQVREVYSQSIQRVWQIAVVFGGVSVLLVLLEKEISLRQHLQTDFGIEGEEKVADGKGLP
ncbi:major facilitator superfamily domain-containing protein [Echria macrotheca]|uniref:Major facilitator superfamily domain-containing protein n=1 Tax=Echria macrotheca TaxID=438768 RepID=A0AAJ0FCY8_9PEZI|nr:major facilitator superfamily domain-containing protein [Echria macrotheca]